MQVARPLSIATTGQYYRFGSDRLYLWVAGGMYLSQVFEGPLRWLLTMLSAGILLYLRDLAAFAVVVLVCFSWLAGERKAFPFVLVVALLLTHTAIGALQLGSLFQSGFGFKVFLAFLLGLAIAPLLPSRTETVLRFASAMFWFTLAGLVLNSFVTFPWIGASFETALGEAASARLWHTGGVLRLPGFSRSSIAAATILALAFVPIASSGSRSWARLAAWPALVWGLALTTTKGVWTGVAVYAGDVLLQRGLGLTVVANAALLTLAGLCLLLPLVALQVDLMGSGVPGVLLSFQERVEDMWPRAFDLLDGPGQVLWGRGLGGIGVALSVADRWKQVNAADNFFVFVLVSFGALGVAYVAVFLYYLVRHLYRHQEHVCTRWMRGWVAILFGYGLTNNMVEDPSFNIVFGILVGLTFTTPQSVRAFEASRRDPEVLRTFAVR